MDAPTNNPDVLKEAHSSLLRKYELHKAKLRELWPTFDCARRIEAVKAGAARGEVLKHPKDFSLGNVYKVFPEWNLRDLTEPRSNYLLDLLEHRSTKSLHELYLSGADNRPGDAEFICESMRSYGLRHIKPFPNCFTIFDDEETYGRSFEFKDAATYRDAMTGPLATAFSSGRYVPQSTGELILQRQTYLTGLLDTVIDDILDLGSTTRDRRKLPDKDAKATQDALVKLSVHQKPKSALIDDLSAAAEDYKSFFDDGLDLLHNEPVALAHELNLWVFSQPELIKDEKGRTCAVHTDKHVSRVMFEMVHSGIVATTRWSYICSLLELLQKFDGEKILRAELLQHLSDACHAEFVYRQKLLKRFLSGPGASGEKYFRRVYDVYDNGVARVNQKVNPNNFPPGNFQLTYFLQLCYPTTNLLKATERIVKLDELWQSSPTERDDMSGRELDALGNLAIIVSFTRFLSSSLKLPPASQTKRRLFTARAAALNAEMNLMSYQIDLSAYASPIDNLLEPGVAQAAWQSLNQFVVNNSGVTLGSLYQDLVKSCIADVQKEYKEKQAPSKENIAPTAETSSFVAFPGTTTESDSKFVIQQRRVKEKARPTHSSFSDIAPQPEPTVPTTDLKPPQVFNVKRSTLSVFSTLFSKAEDRGSVNWSAFVAAMAELRFSVIPISGSIFTFVPPQDGGITQRQITLHRPHGSQLEGYKMKFFARRLSRVYGWKMESFELRQAA
ncbi:hypothetical protein MMC10_011216 [Thelotrema lepadinum]|nr:hypothetical protein [Thelotrema lepadinum]